MPDREQVRKERFEEIFKVVQEKQIRTFDSILCKVREMYPWLKEATIKEYAVSVMRVLEAKPKEIKSANV